MSEGLLTRRKVALLLIGPALLLVSNARAQPSAAAVLAENRTATHIPRTGDLNLTYKFAGFGLTGSASREIDLSTGAYIDSTSAGAVSIGSGFDGTTPWMRDFSGAFTEERGGDRIQLAVNQAYRFANRWWKPDYGGAKVDYLGVDTADGVSADHLAITPRGGKQFDAWFDVGSHLLLRVREVQGFMTTQTLYSDYARVDEATLARAIVMDLGQGPAGSITLTLANTVLRPKKSLSFFACPVRMPRDTTIENGSGRATLNFRLLNNHIYVPVFVNSKGPYTFIVDSGGHLALSPRLAAELGTHAEGNAPESGAGENPASTGFAHIDTVVLGDVRLQNQTAFVTDIYDEAVEGIPVDGMLGFEFFRRFVVRIDYLAHTLTVTDPKRFRFSGAGTAIPLKFYDHLPEVAGRFNKLAVRFDIDTGSRSELDFTSPFVKRADLHSKYPDAVKAMTGWGVGGPVRSTVTRLPALQVGSVKIDNPVVGLSDDVHGSGSDANYDGNIGSALLKRFVVTFDYPRQRLYLKAVKPTPPDVGTFDKSGMWINAGPSGYIVTALDEGGPAFDAGLKSGDIITRIDGQVPQTADLADVRQRLRNLPSGTVVRLDVTRDTDHQTFDVRLQDLIPVEIQP